MESKDDRELVRLAKAGEPEAFAELSARYAGLVRAKAVLFCGRTAPEWEDLFQEGLLALYLAALTYDEARGASFSTYAGACVQNRMTDAARRHGSAKNKPLNESLSLDSEDAASMAAKGGPEDLLELREQVRELFARLGKALTPMERKALTLYLSGEGAKGAERRGMTGRAYENALFRARKKLRQKM